MCKWLRNLFKKDKSIKRYIPLEDVKKINTAFLDELEKEKARLDYVNSKELSDSFHDVLLGAYNGTIEMMTLERKVEFEIKRAEIEERRRNLKPWRRSWLWRLLFQPVTNRAQDIIEERAELDADVVHTAAEKLIDADEEKFEQENPEIYSTMKIKAQAKKNLEEAIKAADESDVAEAIEEPAVVHVEPETVSSVPAVQENPSAAEPAPEKVLETAKKQLPGQMSIADVVTQTRRPRPPRSCRQ